MNPENPRCTIIPVPNVTRVCKVFCGILNCFIPGVGLLVAACIENSPAFMWHFQIALMQFFLIFLFVGFIWGIANGIWMMVSACKPEHRYTEGDAADVIEANGEYNAGAREQAEQRFRGPARRV